MIRVISDDWSWSESSKWIDPDVLGFGKMYANDCETNKKQKLTEKKNKCLIKKKKEKRKLMALIEVYGSPRRLTFELTTTVLWVENYT